MSGRSGVHHGNLYDLPGDLYDDDELPGDIPLAVEFEEGARRSSSKSPKSWRKSPELRVGNQHGVWPGHNSGVDGGSQPDAADDSRDSFAISSAIGGGEPRAMLAAPLMGGLAAPEPRGRFAGIASGIAPTTSGAPPAGSTAAPQRFVGNAPNSTGTPRIAGGAFMGPPSRPFSASAPTTHASQSAGPETTVRRPIAVRWFTPRGAPANSTTGGARAKSPTGVKISKPRKVELTRDGARREATRAWRSPALSHGVKIEVELPPTEERVWMRALGPSDRGDAPPQRTKNGRLKAWSWYEGRVKSNSDVVMKMNSKGPRATGTYVVEMTSATKQKRKKFEKVSAPAVSAKMTPRGKKAAEKQSANMLPRNTAVDIRRAFPASREGWIEMVISAPKVGHVAHGGKAKGESASSKAAAVLQRQRQQQQQQRRSSSSGVRSSRCVSITGWARSASEGGGVEEVRRTQTQQPSTPAQHSHPPPSLSPPPRSSSSSSSSSSCSSSSTEPTMHREAWAILPKKEVSLRFQLALGSSAATAVAVADSISAPIFFKIASESERGRTRTAPTRKKRAAPTKQTKAKKKRR